MTVVVGKVNKIDTNDTKYGTMYNFTVDGKVYGAGKFPPKGIDTGDYIKFEADTSGRYFKMDVKTVTRTEPAGAVAPSTEVTKPSPMVAASSYRGNEEARQLNITRQASRNAAIQWLGFLATNEALGIKKTASIGDRATALDALLEKYTDEFVEFAVNGRKADAGGTDDASVEDDDPYAE